MPKVPLQAGRPANKQAADRQVRNRTAHVPVADTGAPRTAAAASRAPDKLLARGKRVAALKNARHWGGTWGGVEWGGVGWCGRAWLKAWNSGETAAMQRGTH